MHVLFIPSWLSVDKKDSQLGSFFVEQAAALEREGVNVGFLYVKKVSIRQILNYFKLQKSKNGKYGIYENNNIRYIIKPFFTLISRLKIGDYIFYKIYINNLNIYIKKYGRPDLIHFQSMSGVGLLPKILKEKYDIPIVITEHYSGYALNTVNNNDLFQAKENLKKADKFFAVSNFYRDKLNRLFNSDKIKTVPNNLGEEVEGFGKYVKKNEIFTFIVVGNLFSIKNQKIAIIAFKEYLKFHPNAILNIVGMGGEYINLKKLTIDLKIQDHVFFLGKLDRSDTLFQISKSHVLLVTSKVETFSVVTIEALALETLVISTKCGGPEMLINDSNGIICDNPSLYYQSMIEIYENYENYDLRRVRSECISKYSGRNISKILIKEYSKLLYSEK